MERKNYCPYCMTPVAENESCSVCGLTSGTYIPSPHHLPPGTVLMDRYLVGRVLGEGGFGITYIGCDLRLELKVAIKEYYPVDRATRNASASLEVTNFIGPSAKSFERGKHKFLSEAQVMARLDKQQVIVSVRDFFEVNNTAYIVMEYIEGITFRELVEKKGGKISAEELFPMIEPLFRALSIIHENGLIHRDISPDNLMLENGRVRLLDFGCAREAARGTETMTIALKHGYAPIEQYQQKGQGPWTDIYALSATIYYCLTGRVPPQALDRITEDELLLPSKLGIPLSPRLEKALLKGMKLQPSRRFSNAEEMWRAIYTETDADDLYGQMESSQEQPVQPIGSDAKEQTGLADSHTAGTEIGEVSVTEAGRNGVGKEEAGKDGTDITKTGRTEVGIEEAGKDGTGITVVGRNGVSEEEAEQAQNTPGSWSGHMNKKLVCGVGAAAACLLVIAVIALNRASAKDDGDAESLRADVVENTLESDSEMAAGESGGGIASAGQQLFDNAVRFTSGDSQEFAVLMEDDAVAAVIIDCGTLYTSQVTLEKPVQLSAGTSWLADSITITERGYLQMDGTVNIESGGYLRLQGSAPCLEISDRGRLYAGGAFVWMDEESCFAVPEGQIRHQLIFSKDIFYNENTSSATDFASLQSAAESGIPVSIDADITLEDDVYFSVPVHIAEGVTVNTINNEESYTFSLHEDAVLYNEGSLGGNLNLYDHSVIINQGTLSMLVFDMESHPFPSLWVEDEATVVNLGTMKAGDVSRFQEDSLFVNLGELNCYDLYLVGGNMSNLGTVMVSGQDSRFELCNASWFWNKTGGTVTVTDGATVYNGSLINNLGEISVESGSRFDNTALCNHGTFRTARSVLLDEHRESIYYGDGNYEIADGDVKTYHTVYTAREQESWKSAVEVTNEAELLAALDSSEADAVCVKADITVHTDIVVRKHLFIDENCSFTMADDVSFTDYGGTVALLEGASLQGKNVALWEDAQICMEDASRLTIVEGGSLTLDSSILWGWGGDIEMSGAALVMKNRAGVIPECIASFKMHGGTVTLQDGSTLVLPLQCYEQVDIADTILTLLDEGDHSCMYAASDVVLNHCELDLAGGVFQNTALRLNFQNCSVTIGQEGGFYSELSNLSLLGDTTLYNEGTFGVSAWCEYLFTLHGSIVNKGEIELGCRINLSQPIDNQGTVGYYGSHYRTADDYDWNDAWVSGNEPVDIEAQQ